MRDIFNIASMIPTQSLGIMQIFVGQPHRPAARAMAHDFPSSVTGQESTSTLRHYQLTKGKLPRALLLSHPPLRAGYSQHQSASPLAYAAATLPDDRAHPSLTARLPIDYALDRKLALEDRLPHLELLPCR